MDFSASTFTGALKVGVQIASAYRGPHLEIYYEVINQYGPEHEFTVPSITRTGAPDVHKTRFQNTYIQFQLINIGGQRAENIRLHRSGTFQRSENRDFGGLFETVIPQMAPGQVLQLFLLDSHELERIGEDRRVDGFQQGELIITAEFHSPGGLVNAVKTAYPRLRRKPHHRMEFRFSPQLVMGDLPPARYA
jgi:hypothetical protein